MTIVKDCDYIEKGTRSTYVCPNMPISWNAIFTNLYVYVYQAMNMHLRLGNWVPQMIHFNDEF